jgi:WD40 repeat protein
MLHKQEAHDEGVWSAVWVPNSSRMLTGSLDETVKSWESTPDSMSMRHSYQVGHNS